MKRVKAGLVGLSLWYCTGAAGAQEIIWPAALSAISRQSSQPHVPVVSVLRPIPLSASAEASLAARSISDSSVTRAGYLPPAQDSLGRAARAKKDAGPPRELPDFLKDGADAKPVADTVKRTEFTNDSAGPMLDLESGEHTLPIVPTPAKPPDSPAAGPLPNKTEAETGEQKARGIPAFKLAVPSGRAADQGTNDSLPQVSDSRVGSGAPDERKRAAPERITPIPQAWHASSSGSVASPALPAAIDAACSATLAIDGEECGVFGLGLVGKMYARGESLLWQIRGAAIPTLVTTGPVASSGILGNGGVPLLGPGSLEQRIQAGGKFTVGYWLDSCETTGIEVSGFVLGEAERSLAFSSDQFPLLARPFFRLNPPFAGEASQVATSPGVATGTVAVNQSSRLWGAEANARCNVCRGCEYRVDILTGFRYLDLQEDLAITEDLFATPGGSPFGGDRVMVADNFRTRDQFFGGQVGIDAEWSWGRWFVETRSKIGLGVTHQTIDISGSQTITPPGGLPGVTSGGLLALSSNSGHFTKNHFSVVPEIGLNVGYDLTDRLRIFAGYSFLYWSGVVRPGDQIDRGLDVNRIMNFLPPQPPIAQVRPAVPFKETDFWAQGINLGVQYQF